MITEYVAQQEDFSENIKKLKNILSCFPSHLAPATIGARLRDVHGIPSVRRYTGKKLCSFLKNNEKVYQKFRISDKITKLTTHCAKHIKDYVSKRQLPRYFAKKYNLE